MRSNTCKGPNGQFLEEYHSETAATIAAEEIQKSYSTILNPYQCRACGYWHLRTEITRKQCYLCKDSSLFQKDIYSTKEEAQSTAAYLRKEKKVQLFPYRCPHGSGWHLTKTDHSKRSAKKWFWITLRFPIQRIKCDNLTMWECLKRSYDPAIYMNAAGWQCDYYWQLAIGNWQ